MSTEISTLTERGQVSVPASLRRNMGLHTGQKLRWERISERECRVIIEDQPVVVDPISALGFGPRLRNNPARRTADWMKELRDAE